MQYGIVAVAAAPVRKKADHRSEMVNQLLFGEAVRVIKNNKDGWTDIEGLHDGYKGWMQSVMLSECSKKSSGTKHVATGMNGRVTINGHTIRIPAGSSLPMLAGGKGKLGDLPYSFAGKCTDAVQVKPSAAILARLLRPWINAPYLWGGRTPMGVDCSGLVQVVFKQMGIFLPRDAWQQAEKGKQVKSLLFARPGDLAFFERKGKIIHVGIIMPGEKVIHASGKVKIDRLTDKGIIHPETGKVTVKLERIRRVL